MNVRASLEERYRVRLRPVREGSEARVYRADDKVFKVFGQGERHLAEKEAENMAKAGLQSYLVQVLELEGHGVLVLKRFPGKPFSREGFDQAKLEALAETFRRLHAMQEAGVSSRSKLEERLVLFEGALEGLEITSPNGLSEAALPLLDKLRGHLDEVSGIPFAFCHNDPWAGNVLLKDKDAPQTCPEVLLVDWGRAGGEDPARDLAILKTGSLDLLGTEAANAALKQIVGTYPDKAGLWRRLRFYVPLTYLHDLYWFNAKQPDGFLQAAREKLPLAISFYHSFAD
ncbi:MAG: aminoglycoside phosphotransferase family protein [Deinococcus sp.]|nr:aminoglycoside phosphotransferase family protein [Deinococcus sp.]MCL5965409.1 aminoglycoside phosphotransferase family protein [Deinococcus sp.]